MTIEERVRLLAPRYAENVDPDGWLSIHVDYVVALVEAILEENEKP